MVRDDAVAVMFRREDMEALAAVRASAREHPDLETRVAAAAALDRLDPAPWRTTGRALVF